MTRGFVWASLSKKSFGSDGDLAHLLGTHGSAGRYKDAVAQCGLSARDRRSWRKDDDKPKCTACQKSQRR